MSRQAPIRQRIRKGVILTTFLLFPIIMNYFSPYVIIDGASQGTPALHLRFVQVQVSSTAASSSLG